MSTPTLAPFLTQTAVAGPPRLSAGYMQLSELAGRQDASDPEATNPVRLGEILPDLAARYGLDLLSSRQDDSQPDSSVIYVPARFGFAVSSLLPSLA